MVEPTPRANPELHVPAPEAGSVRVERQLEHQPVPSEQRGHVQPMETLPATPVSPIVTTSAPTATPLVTRVETILSAGLQDAYQAMDPQTQVEFKRVGESTASTIARMLKQSKVQVKKIVQLILAWLKIIPRSNPFYLEQEAKIKADKIMAATRSETQVTP